MGKWIAVACLSIAGIVAVFMATNDITADLQAALVEKATLRRQVVALEEENRVFHEVFECAEIRRRLGL